MDKSNQKLSLYWKCQLFGWGSFGILTYIINVAANNGALFLEIGGSLMVLPCIMLTHIIRILIKALKVFRKGFILQVTYLLLLNLIVSFVAVLLFVSALDSFRMLKAITPKNIPGASFLQVFAFLYYQVSLTVSAWLAIYFFVHYIRRIMTTEQEKAALKIELFQSEAKALRTQMNPHFIFNCLNAIKSLMQENKIDKGINYLTTFSKLIRTLLSNAEKREITLNDEIETCKLYLKLEEMRFGISFSYSIQVDENLDAKSVQIPALIIQPFLENAVWHGIVPRGGGGCINLSVGQMAGNIEIIIDDNGIGREASKRNNSAIHLNHHSNGVSLTLSRLELDNLLQQRHAELEMIDKKDEMNKTKGTKVIITLNDE